PRAVRAMPSPSGRVTAAAQGRRSRPVLARGPRASSAPGAGEAGVDPADGPPSPGASPSSGAPPSPDCSPSPGPSLSPGSPSSPGVPASPGWSPSPGSSPPPGSPPSPGAACPTCRATDPVTGFVAPSGLLAVAGRVVPDLRGHEHRDRVRGDRHGAAAGIPARALDDLVGAVGLHLVQPVVEPGHAVDRLGDRLVGGVEHR